MLVYGLLFACVGAEKNRYGKYNHSTRCVKELSSEAYSSRIRFCPEGLSFFNAIVKISQVLSLQRKSISLLSPPLLEDTYSICVRARTPRKTRQSYQLFLKLQIILRFFLQKNDIGDGSRLSAVRPQRGHTMHNRRS